MHIYTYTCRIHIDAIIKTNEDFFKKNIPRTLLSGLHVRWSWEIEQNCNILTPTLMAISVVSFSFSKAAQPGGGGEDPPSAGWWLSLPNLVSN